MHLLRNTVGRRLPMFFFPLLLAGLLPLAPAHADVRAQIFEMFDDINEGLTPVALPTEPHARDTLGLFYGKRNYEPAWANYEAITPVLAEIGASELEGLDPEDYHYSVLKSLEAEYFQARGQRVKDRLHAAFDILLTDAVLLYARHLQEGKSDPARVEPTWNFARVDFTPAATAQRVQDAVEAGEVLEKLESFKPRVRVYRLAKGELARYRDIDARYEFSPIPDNTVLRPGMQHENVAALRTALARLGYPVADAPDTKLFDDELEAAVKDFQSLHTLDADGIVGRGTFRELNVPYEDRVDQLRLNLDRLRWVRNDISDHMVIVNIAGFELYYFRDDQLFWETGVMVGKIKHQTPIFRHDITYLEFNPTWTVPRSIIGRSLYPKFSADPSYVAEHNFKLYNSDGVEVDPMSLDWSQYSRNRFPFRVVQQPGPNNALGRVKFMFPNKYAIYLHDTPSRALFSRTSRAFSSGCIRVRDPLYFAELLLADEAGWDRARIDATIEEAKRRVVRLSEPVDVMLMYWTTSPTSDGRIQYHQDIYNRDPRTLALLDEEPSWHD